jgi:methionyl-tRNA formyltransferase
MYDSIRYLASKGYHFAAIVTEKAYDEYDIKEEHFQQLANELGSPFFCTGNLNVPELIELVNRENVQIAISANWRYKVPKKFLEIFGCGIFNYHLGNLPDYNGNATINWTLVHGLDYINGNIHKMDPELDSGDIVVRDSIRIEESDYVNDVMKKAQAQVPGLFEKALDLLWANPAHYELKGSSSGSRCFPRLPEDSQIDWTKPAHEIYCLIRASAEPYDGAYTYLNGEKVIVWRAQPYYPPYEFYAIPGHVVSVSKEAGVLVACGKGMLRLQKIESNGNSMAAEDQIKSIRLRFKYNHNG